MSPRFKHIECGHYQMPHGHGDPAVRRAPTCAVLTLQVIYKCYLFSCLLFVFSDSSRASGSRNAHTRDYGGHGSCWCIKFARAWQSDGLKISYNIHSYRETLLIRPHLITVTGTAEPSSRLPKVIGGFNLGFDEDRATPDRCQVPLHPSPRICSIRSSRVSGMMDNHTVWMSGREEVKRSRRGSRLSAKPIKVEPWISTEIRVDIPPTRAGDKGVREYIWIRPC